jgi:hypothetical protein
MQLAPILGSSGLPTLGVLRYRERRRISRRHRQIPGQAGGSKVVVDRRRGIGDVGYVSQVCIGCQRYANFIADGRILLNEGGRTVLRAFELFWVPALLMPRCGG